MDQHLRSDAKRFVILDRDGTLIVDRGYLGDPAGVELLPNAAEGLRLLRSLGLGVIVVSNQSGIARGYFELAAVDAVNSRLRTVLAAHDVKLDDIFICPHGPDDGCNCRKPKPGLVKQAAERWGFAPAECVVVGNQPCDVALGRAVGAKTIYLVGSGAPPPGLEADASALDLVEAAEIVRHWLRDDRTLQNRS